MGGFERDSPQSAGSASPKIRPPLSVTANGEEVLVVEPRADGLDYLSMSGEQVALPGQALSASFAGAAFPAVALDLGPASGTDITYDLPTSLSGSSPFTVSWSASAESEGEVVLDFSGQGSFSLVVECAAPVGAGQLELSAEVTRPILDFFAATENPEWGVRPYLRQRASSSIGAAESHGPSESAAELTEVHLQPDVHPDKHRDHHREHERSWCAAVRHVIAVVARDEHENSHRRDEASRRIDGGKEPLVMGREVHIQHDEAHRCTEQQGSASARRDGFHGGSSPKSTPTGKSIASNGSARTVWLRSARITSTHAPSPRR